MSQLEMEVGLALKLSRGMVGVVAAEGRPVGPQLGRRQSARLAPRSCRRPVRGRRLTQQTARRVLWQRPGPSAGFSIRSLRRGSATQQMGGSLAASSSRRRPAVVAALVLLALDGCPSELSRAASPRRPS